MPAENKSGKAKGQSAEPTDTALRKMQEAHAAFLDRLDASVQKAREQAREALREHIRTMAEMEDSFERERSERVQTFVSSLKSAEGDEPDRRSLRSARFSVEDDLQQLERDLHSRGREALSKHEDAIAATRQQIQQEIQRAFTEYVGSVNAVLTDIDEGGPDVHTVAAVGEMLISAAVQVNALSGR